MHKASIKYILIACCTCKRPNMLRKALESIKELELDNSVKIELLVVDNDKEASAKKVVDSINADFPVRIHYFVEEKRGIARARNRVLKEAIKLGASHIALFDDDEIVDKKWLISHIEYYKTNPDALIVSGPTFAKFEKKYPKFIEKNNIFKSTTTKTTGRIREVCASGNVFFPLNISTKDKIFFDESYVFMGGEDGDFFSRASAAGYTIMWNNDAINYEMINDKRANLKWIFCRNYYNGYSDIFLKSKYKTSYIYKFLLFIKLLFIFIIDIAAILFSLILGPAILFNTVGMTYKTKGKIDALIYNKALNYYENICGD